MTVRVVPHQTTGAILLFYMVEADPAFEITPPDAGTPIEFDEETNAALWADLQLGSQRALYTLLAGVLRKAGVVQTINPDGEAETDRKAIPNRKAQIETYMGLLDLTVPPDLADIAAGSNAAAIVAYINGTLVPRINQLDTLVQRTNANTNATQGIFQILRYIGVKLGIFG